MLDNLKLGYGGTKTEMERLIADAAKLDSSIQANDMSFGNIVKAIHAVQDEMGITGTTALEAGRTISGSVGAMSAAWTNLITGLSDGNADIGQLVNNLVTTIVGDGTESNLGVLGNVMPAVKTALSGASRLVSELLPQIVQEIPSIINDNLPVLAEAAISIIQSLVDGISQNQEMLMTTAMETITYLATSLISMLPQIVQLGLDLIVSLASGISQNIGTLIPTIIDVVLQIVDTLTNPETLSQLLDAALTLILALAEGLLSEDSINGIIDAIFMLIDNIITFLTDPENILKLINTGWELVSAIIEGLLNARDRIREKTKELIKNLIDKFKETDWGKVGKDIIDGVLNGLKNAWTKLSSWFTEKWDNLVGGVKDLLGIHSPSRVFAGIGKNMALGVGEGWEDEFRDIEKEINGSMDFDDATFGVNAYGSYSGSGAFGGTSFGTVNINIEGANVQDDAALADMVAERLQRMTERRGAVFA